MKVAKRHRLNRLMRKIKNKIFFPLRFFFAEHLNIFVYTFLFLVGLTMMALIFWLPEDWKNAINICCGIGSGVFTSILVTTIINAENQAREKQRLKKEKEFLLNDIILSSLDVYEDVIYRINEYITLSELPMDCVYGLYADFKPFNVFADYLKTIDLNKFSKAEKKRLQKLFNFRNYRIDRLISNLKHLPRQEYFLRGLLSQEEYQNLVGNTANDAYLSYAEHINKFWNDEILDLTKCIQFLRMTIYISAKTISTFDYAINKAKAADAKTKEDIDRLYFEEVYSQSEEYILSQINAEIDKWNYYAEHPEELEELERLYNLTEEDLAIEELWGCISGFSVKNAADILEKLDKNSSKVKSFFSREDIRKMLRKKRRINSIIKAKYGRRYLKEISKSEEQINEQAENAQHE